MFCTPWDTPLTLATSARSKASSSRPLARQRMVYATLGDRLATDEVHALSMKTFTPAEWAQQGGQV